MRDREQARKRAEDLVARMTLEERASQLRYEAPAIPRKDCGYLNPVCGNQPAGCKKLSINRRKAY